MSFGRRRKELALSFYVFLHFRSTLFRSVTQHTVVVTPTLKGQATQKILLDAFNIGLEGRPETSVNT
jgi:hypothetical protein